MSYKKEISLKINNIIEDKNLLKIKDEKGKMINDLPDNERKIFLRGIDVGLSISLDIVQNN